MNEAYKEQVRLLLQALPEVAVDTRPTPHATDSPRRFAWFENTRQSKSL